MPRVLSFNIQTGSVKSLPTVCTCLSLDARRVQPLAFYLVQDTKCALLQLSRGGSASALAIRPGPGTLSSEIGLDQLLSTRVLNFLPYFLFLSYLSDTHSGINLPSPREHSLRMMLSIVPLL